MMLDQEAAEHASEQGLTQPSKAGGMGVLAESTLAGQGLGPGLGGVQGTGLALAPLTNPFGGAKPGPFGKYSQHILSTYPLHILSAYSLHILSIFPSTYQINPSSNPPSQPPPPPPLSVTAGAGTGGFGALGSGGGTTGPFGGFSQVGLALIPQCPSFSAPSSTNH